jgi:hypothetical protein
MAKVSLNRCREVKARSGARRSERLSAANDLLLFAWKQGWQLGDIACDPAQQRWLSTISRRFLQLTVALQPPISPFSMIKSRVVF